MKIIGICCSPRPNGNTELLINEALKAAAAQGAATELFSVAGKDIRPCVGCFSCDKTGVCVIKDDVAALFKKMTAADGIIFGTPIYNYTVTPWLKCIMDRTVSLMRSRGLNNKVGGVVVTAGSLGMGDGLKDIYFWMVTRQMLPANFVAAYGLEKGEVLKMPGCAKAARDLGTQVALLAAMKFRYPEQIEPARYGYGTWLK